LNLNNTHIELKEKNKQNLKSSQAIDNHTKNEKNLSDKINKNIDKITNQELNINIFLYIIP
jgi:hypothetical protein